MLVISVTHELGVIPNRSDMFLSCFKAELDNYFLYVMHWPWVVQNYPELYDKGNKSISHKTYQNTSSL